MQTGMSGNEPPDLAPVADAVAATAATATAGAGVLAADAATHATADATMLVSGYGERKEQIRSGMINIKNTLQFLLPKAQKLHSNLQLVSDAVQKLPADDKKEANKIMKLCKEHNQQQLNGLNGMREHLQALNKAVDTGSAVVTTLLNDRSSLNKELQSATRLSNQQQGRLDAQAAQLINLQQQVADLQKILGTPQAATVDPVLTDVQMGETVDEETIDLEGLVIKSPPSQRLPPELKATWEKFNGAYYLWDTAGKYFLTGPFHRPTDIPATRWLAVNHWLKVAAKEVRVLEEHDRSQQEHRQRMAQEDADRRMAEREQQEELHRQEQRRLAALSYKDIMPDRKDPQFALPEEHEWSWDKIRKKWRVQDILQNSNGFLSDEEEAPPKGAAAGSGFNIPKASSRGPKVPTPTKYSGRTSLDDTLFAFESYLMGNGVPKEHWALHAGNLLEGQALQTYTSFAKPLGRTPTWEEFKECLSAFQRPDVAFQARKELHTIQQSGSVREYLQRFNLLIGQSGNPPPTEQDKIMMFWNGLKTPVQQMNAVDPITGIFWESFSKLSSQVLTRSMTDNPSRNPFMAPRRDKLKKVKLHALQTNKKRSAGSTSKGHGNPSKKATPEKRMLTKEEQHHLFDKAIKEKQLDRNCVLHGSSHITAECNAFKRYKGIQIN